MKVDSIELTNYRNIESAAVALSPGVNVLCGENGQGKTNTLEAINIFAQGRAFRTRSEKELVRWLPGKPETDASNVSKTPDNSPVPAEYAAYAGVKLRFTDRTGPAVYEYYASADGKSSRVVNGKPVRSAAEFIGRFRAVLFSPEHLELVKGPPAVRRAFVDIAISQLDPVYLGCLSRYMKLAEQRNSLLRQWKFTTEQMRSALPTFTPRMAEEAAYITASRERWLQSVERFARDQISQMTSGKELVSLTYAGKKSEAEFAELYASFTDRDIERGTTTIGPHRDDFTVLLNGLPAKSFASQGQQRTITLALKLGEGEEAMARTGEYPVFLLDDVLSELDAARREYLLARLTTRQVVITACESEIAVPGVKKFKVVNGKITE